MERRRARTGDSRSLVGFYLGGGAFAVEVPAVLVITLPGVVAVYPHPSPLVRGVTEYNGRIVALVDLRDHFGLAAAAPAQRMKWILVEVGETWFGLIADEVTTVFAVGDADLRPIEDLGPEARGEFVRSVYARGPQLVMELDLDAVARAVGGPRREPT